MPEARVIRYQVKPEAADENARLVQAVFTELAESKPEGFHYATFRLEDGVSFMHVAIIEGENPLGTSPAFSAFQSTLGERCTSAPEVSVATVVGSYEFGAPV